MHTYCCKNCNNIVGKWCDKHKCHYVINFCNYINLKNNELIYFLNCKKCNKFIGIYCLYICEICFGKDEIIGEKKLFKWFQKYKKLTPNYKNFIFYCKKCYKSKFRCQYWFFEELTFYK